MFVPGIFAGNFIIKKEHSPLQDRESNTEMFIVQ